MKHVRLRLLVSLLCIPSVGIAANAAQQTIVMPDKTGKLHWFSVTHDVMKEIKKDHGVLVNSLKRISSPLPLEEIKAGGIGGNEATGFIYYDDQTGPGHAPALHIERNPLTKTCYLQNTDVVIRDWKQNLDVVSFPCEQPDPTHGNLFWKNSFDMTNGSYNPGLDAFAVADAANNMYQMNFSQPLWSQWPIGRVQTLIFIHSRTTYFDMGGMFNMGTRPWIVFIGDGDDKSYPWTTPDVLGSLIAQGTAMSTWGYSWGSGNGPGIAQSYSDLFGKVIEYRMSGNVDWTIGKTTARGWGWYDLRYMDDPNKDCTYHSGSVPGVNCSLDNYDDYKKHLLAPANYGAGLLNKVFYLLATSPGWDIQQVFNLVNHATYYWGNPDWNPDSDTFPEDHLNYRDVFCSLITAGQDYQFDVKKMANITDALKQVAFDTTICSTAGMKEKI